MGHMIGVKNFGLITNRSIRLDAVQHFFVTSCPVDFHILETAHASQFLFPLYLYPTASKQEIFAFEVLTSAPKGRRPNLNPTFIADMEQRLGMRFIPDGKGDLQSTFGPEDVFSYMYAVFHCPTYRSRYAELLKIDFPRLPLTSDPDLFRKLCGLGGQLVGLHLLEQPGPIITSHTIPSDNRVEKVQYTSPGQGAEKGRVWINKTQYFEGVPPEVWEFHIGGYQVAHKWLKDRKGRMLTFEDLMHYQGVIAALAETIRLMQEVDEAISEWPMS